ncbi:MAG: carboxypeptidase regulatory-like domain-containing protein, partial [Bryobacteraceae bacterium]|nr:carboxypeptidase regulatory-like domain-containing protein [Bryobacteraceae bacterium]
MTAAQLELVNSLTGVRYETRSDGQGAYRFQNIPVGNYRLQTRAQGFATRTIGNIPLNLARTQTINIALQVANASTSFTVESGAVPIDTTTPHLQTFFGSREATQLPLTGAGMLGVLNLSMLSAGVGSSGGIGYGTGPSVGGQRPTNNNFTIEGVDNNNRAVTGPNVSLSNEVVEEFSLQLNQFSPEVGHSSGGQFSSILKSGSNAVRGSVYEYFQNRNLNAIDESFLRLGVRSKPRYDQNRFGGTIGGPAIKDRLFYFGALEFQRLGQAAASSGAMYAPTADGYGVLSSIQEISRTNLEMLKRYVPAATAASRNVAVSGRTVPVGIVSTVGPSYLNDVRPVISADYHISQRDQLRGRWVANSSDSTDNSAGLAGFFTPVRTRNQLASLTHIHTFSPALINELRLGYSRTVEDRPAGSQEFTGLDAFPNIRFSDLSLSVGPHPAYPQSNRSNMFQLSENLAWSRGRHTVKLGYDGRKLNSNNFFVQRQRGEYSYRTLERYLVDLTPETAQRSVGALPYAGNLLSHYGYVNDELRVRPNFVLNVGVRYEFVDVPAGSKLQALNGFASVPGIIEFAEPRPEKLNLAPRLGLAWSPGATGRTAIRAGFGLAYDQVFLNQGLNSLPPQFFSTVDAHVDRPNQPDFLASGGIRPDALAITNPASARSLTSTWIPHQQRPYSIQWNAGVKHVIASDYTIEVRYLGTRGIHLPFQVQINRAAGVVSGDRSLPTYFDRPSQEVLDALPLSVNDFRGSNTLAAYGFGRSITSFMPRGNSSYHGLASQLNRRFSRGFQVSAAHTWSHNIDDSTAVVGSTVLTPRRAQDFFNLRAERADSALDRRHRFTASWVYESQWFQGNASRVLTSLVAGWSFSGTYTAETGAPATVRSDIDSNLNGDALGDRSVINTKGDENRSSAVTPLLNSQRAVVGYLAVDPSARYIQAGQGVFPNGGRNTLRLPSINNFDLALGKTFSLSESVRMQFRAEAYNAFNHAQFVSGFPSSANLR